jgi:hypothetical protein
MMAWLAVRYRYRICAECNDEFKALLANASQLWRAWTADEEQNYKLERISSGRSGREGWGTGRLDQHSDDAYHAEPVLALAAA